MILEEFISHMFDLETNTALKTLKGVWPGSIVVEIVFKDESYNAHGERVDQRGDLEDEKPLVCGAV